MKQKGFTLAELLVTIAIIGILSSLAILSFGNSARQEKVRASGEIIKEFLRNTQLLSHKEGKQLGLKFSSNGLTLYADSLCAGSVTLDEVELDNNTQIGLNLSITTIADITAPPKTAGWSGNWSDTSQFVVDDCLKIDPSSEGSVFPDGGSLGVTYTGSTSGVGAIIYKKADDRRIHLQFSRDGISWRKL